MRSIIICFLILLSFASFGQTDTSKQISPLDKLSPDELLQYYINEKAPEYPKGPLFVGDSLYGDLNNRTIPTNTVMGEGIYRGDIDSRSTEDGINGAATNDIQALKPKISIGAGRLGFYGDLYEKTFQSPLTARLAYDLNVSQRLTRYLQLNFNVMFGKLGANEFTLNRYENFQSEIRAGGLNLLYDFGNFIPDRYKVRPFVSIGITGFEFLSKTDLFDKNGIRYNYWSDGSIKDMAEGSAGAMFAKDIKRDYVYETDIRERNADGFGKYPERAFAMPIGVGFIMQVTERVDAKFNFQLFFSSTDYIDGVTNKSVGNRIGNTAKDNFSYSSFSIQYDLLATKTAKQPKDAYGKVDWLALDNEDHDKDGVRDWDDKCHGTPEGVKVNEFGCPEDDDKDGVANYMDDENPSPPGAPVNGRGVAQTDEYWARWYAEYNDTVGLDKKTEYVGNIFDLASNKPKMDNDKTMYTIELGRYANGVPSEEMAVLLSIGDIRSTTLEDGTTVIYTAGNYDKISKAIKRRDAFLDDGSKNAKVSTLKGKRVETLTDDDVQKLLAKEKAADLLAGNNSGNTNGNGTNNGNASNNGNNSASNNGNGTNNGNASNNGNNSGNANGNNSGSNNGNNSGNNNGINNGNTTNNGNNTGNDNGSGTNNGNATNNGNNSGNTNGNVNDSNNGKEVFSDEAEFGKNDIVYRVQLGAYKNKINPSIFNTSAGVLELKMGENLFRYVTRGYKTIEDAASIRADLVIQGYSDAFVTAYQGGKRIPLNKTKATVESNFKEDLNEEKTFSSVNKNLVKFKIQLGALKKSGKEAEFNELFKDVKDLEMKGTNTGMLRYTAGSFTNYDEAEKFRKQLEELGFSDAFIIATFKSDVISIQEAMELLK